MRYTCESLAYVACHFGWAHPTALPEILGGADSLLEAVQRFLTIYMSDRTSGQCINYALGVPSELLVFLHPSLHVL